MKTKLQSFETYRGIAALMIAAIHFNVNSPLSNHIFANGLFVHFFFTLSGFVMQLNYGEKIISFEKIYTFLKKRFFRLYPLHILFFLIFLLIEFSKYYLEYNYGLKANNPAFSENNTIAIFANLFLLQTFLDYNSFNDPSWSISAEYFTYIFFAVILFLIPKNNLFIISLLLGILILRLKSNTPFGISFTYWSLIDCIYCYYFGVISCKLYFKYFQSSYYKRFYQLFTIVFLFLSALSIAKLEGKNTILMPLIFGILLFFSANLKYENFLGKIVCNKFLVYIGTISYSIYMSHLFIFWAITQFMRFVLKVSTYIDIDGAVRLELSNFEANVVVVISYTITILTSHFLYHFFERKFYKPT